MTDTPANADLEAVETRDLLSRVGTLDLDGNAHRCNPLLDPPSFRELSQRLNDLVDEPYDVIVVRDLFADKMLGYQLALDSGKPVFVSSDREGIITLDRERASGEGERALIAADLHFTLDSIRAGKEGLETAGMSAIGLALLLRLHEDSFTFPVWSLERGFHLG